MKLIGTLQPCKEDLAKIKKSALKLFLQDNGFLKYVIFKQI